MRNRLKVLIPVLVIALVAGIYFVYFKKEINPNQVKVSGNIEVTTVGVGFKVSGHVGQRLVDEGDSVKKGQIVANLETADLELEVANANAQLLAAQATLTQLLNGSRPQDVSVAQAVLRSAEADKQNAAVEYQRMKQLFIQGAVSEQDRDRSQTAYANAN
ncbi:MAG: biotin/lipoyl-binding protein, partial [Negativicutes bacterium]|nr:biotin/lipoyl-binding protein [Negativicutes bacterium]